MKTFSHRGIHFKRLLSGNENSDKGGISRACRCRTVGKVNLVIVPAGLLPAVTNLGKRFAALNIDGTSNRCCGYDSVGSL